MQHSNTTQQFNTPEDELGFIEQLHSQPRALHSLPDAVDGGEGFESEDLATTRERIIRRYLTGPPLSDQQVSETLRLVPCSLS